MSELTVIESNVDLSIGGSQEVVQLTLITEGPQGPAGAAGGGSGSGTRINQAAPASTWTFSHAFGRPPSVQVFLSSGEAVIADIVCTNTQITVSFASPQSGFVIAG